MWVVLFVKVLREHGGGFEGHQIFGIERVNDDSFRKIPRTKLSILKKVLVNSVEN